MKNKIKKIILGAVAICSMPLLVACGGKQTLKKPTSLKFDETTSVVTWKEVENADYYVVEINGKTYQTTSSSFPASEIVKDGGKYNIRVEAYDHSGNYLPSGYSEYITYTNEIKFDAPVLNVDGYILNWEPIQDAEYYALLVNGVKFITTETNFDLTTENDFSSAIVYGKENTFQVYVISTSNHSKSDVSNQISKVLANVQTVPTNLNVSKNLDKIILSFDAPESAETFTLKINDTEYQITSNEYDITSLIDDFAEYSISVMCNEVFDGETMLYMKSNYSEILTYENIPDFVNEYVQNVAVNENVITYDETINANIYYITIDGETYTTTSCEFDLHSLALSVGHHSISVVAGYGEYRSLPSTIDYVITQILLAPQISVSSTENGVIVSISEVENVSEYQITINQTIITKASVRVNISNYIVDGANTISVVAVGDGDVYLNSVPSNTVTYISLSAPRNLSVQNGILTFDESTGATEYNVFINDEKIATITQTEFDISNYVVEPNEYIIKVSAQADSTISGYSQISYITTQKLSAPTNLSLTEQDGLVLLNFDAQQNATKYELYVNDSLVATNITSAENIDITNKLSFGNNTIQVVSVGDGKIYLNSEKSESVEYILTRTLSQVSNISVYAQNGKYYLSFDGVNDADSYFVEILDSENTVLSSNSTNLTVGIDIDSAITKTDTYTIKVTANNSSEFVASSTASITQIIKSYNSADYETTEYFYRGKTYTYVAHTEYELEEFVLYAVLYRIDKAEIYVDFDYDNMDNAFTSTTSLLDKYLPTVSKYGVDIYGSTDIISQLLTADNFTKLKEIITFLERAHDQIYLYYDVTSELTSQKSNRVYTLNFTYAGDEEATKSNADSGNSPAMQRTQANLPVGYTVSSSTRTFAIDSCETAPVETVAQLIMVVQNNRKPQFTKQNTIAEQTYNKAREVLSEICTDSMTDYQKALAIHDYIVTNNHYDDSTYESASGTPINTENLSDMAFTAAGMLLKNLSVCKGIEEAFLLMCNIEGIKTTECFGIVGSGIDWSTIDFTNPYSLYALMQYDGTIGAHSWNRIYLDVGEGYKWYIVDPTWDDDVINSTEYLSHEYFLSNESSISSNRKELYPNGTYYKQKDESGNEINFTADGSYNYYADSTNKICTYISSQDDLNAVVQNMLQNMQNGFEIYCTSSVINNYSNMIKQAFSTYEVSSSQYDIKRWDNYVFVCKK